MQAGQPGPWRQQGVQVPGNQAARATWKSKNSSSLERTKRTRLFQVKVVCFWP